MLDWIRWYNEWKYAEKFSKYEDGYKWYQEFQKDLKDLPETYDDPDQFIIDIIAKARDPFQFLSKSICIEGINNIHMYQLPVTQDASASAYQLMSYFLLDKDLAIKTNLITDESNNEIKDIYNIFLEEFKAYMHSQISSDIYDIVSSRLTRKLIKGIFMPLIYGKTEISIKNDIYHHFSSILKMKECTEIAKLIIKFFDDRYPGIRNLMNLVKCVGWFCAALNKPVFYSIPYYTTVQDYMMTESVNVWVWDNNTRNKRKITLKIPKNPSHRDRRKTCTSTFANFIHQKDAGLAMYMIKEMINQLNAPVYTVHDNFLSNVVYTLHLPRLYSSIFLRYHPLKIINEYIVQNLQKGLLTTYPLDQPLPLNYIKTALMDRLPDKKDKNYKIYLNKVDDMCTYYENYITKSLGYPKLYNGTFDIEDNTRFDQFNDALRRQSTLSYCLHL